MKDKNAIPCGLVPKKSKRAVGTGAPANPTVKSILLDFIAKQEKFNTSIISRLDNIDSRLDNIDSRLDNIVKLNNLNE